MSAERLHHPFSPSKLQYLEASPYWTGQESSDNEKSQAGTRQHDAAEHSIDIDDPRLSDEEAEAVAMCKAYRDQIIAAYGPGVQVIKEEYVPIDDETVEDEKGNKFQGTTGGYLDLAIVHRTGTVADILDWKFGAWSVEPAENNLQGMAYLLGLLKRFPKLEEVTVHFVMPHREEIDKHTFTRKEFDKLRLRVVTVVQRAIQARKEKNFAKCSPTITTCLFCGNKGKCEALAGFALSVAKKYSPTKVPEQITPSLINDPKLAKQSMEVAQLMEGWAKAVRAQVTARAIEDDVWVPDGYTLRSRSDNSVVDWRKVLKFARKHGVPGSAIRESLTICMTPLNTAINDAAPRGQKKAATEAFREELLAEGALEKEAPVIFLERNKT